MTPNSAATTPSEQVRVRPTLILAVGELGGKILRGLRLRIAEKFGSLDEFPIVACCWLNLQGRSSAVLALEDTLAPRFRRGEILSLDPGSASSADPSARSLGTRLLRKHERHLKAFLREAHAKVRDPLLGDRLLQSEVVRQQGLVPHISFNDKTQVFLIGAVSEPLTSGAMLELSAALASLFAEGSYESTACLVLDHVLPDCRPRHAQAETYAFLRELEGSYHDNAPPIHNCYLLEYGDSTEPAEQYLIDVLLSDFSEGEFGDHKRSVRINLRQNYRKLFNYHDGQFQQRFYSGFASLGLASFQIPHDPIINYGSQHLAAELLREWVGQAPKSHEISEYLRNHLLDQLPIFEDKLLKRQDVVTSLLNRGSRSGGDDSEDLVQPLSAWHQETYEAFRPMLRTGPLQGLLEAVNENIRGFEVRQLWMANANEDSDSAGAMLLRIRRHAERWRRNAYTLIERELMRLVDEKGHGLAFLKAVLLEIGQVLQKSQAYLEERSDRHAAVVYQGSEYITRFQAEFSRALARHNLDGRKRIILEHLLDKYLGQHSGVGNPHGAFLNNLLKNACRQGALACAELLEELLGRKRADGVRAGGLLGNIDHLLQQVHSGADELDRGWISACQVGVDRLYPLEHPMEYYCKIYWPEGNQRTEMFRRVQRAQGWSLKGLSQTWDLTTLQGVHTALLRECRARLEGIRKDYHVLRFLFRECSTEQRERFLHGWVQHSTPRVHLEEGGGAATLPELEAVALVGVPLPNPHSSAAERNELEGYAEMLRQWLHSHYSQGLSFYPTPDVSRLILYQEIGGFPLQALSRLPHWKDSYVREIALGTTLHMLDCRYEPSEIQPLTPAELHSLEEACELLLVAELVDLISRSEGEYVYWEKEGCWRTPHPVGGAYFLATAPQFRKQLLQKARSLAAGSLAGDSVEQVATLAVRLERHKKWLKATHGAAGRLSLLEQIQLYMVRQYEARIQENPAVRALTVERFSDHVESLLESDSLCLS